MAYPVTGVFSTAGVMLLSVSMLNIVLECAFVVRSVVVGEAAFSLDIVLTPFTFIFCFVFEDANTRPMSPIIFPFALVYIPVLVSECAGAMKALLLVQLSTQPSAQIRWPVRTCKSDCKTNLSNVDAVLGKLLLCHIWFCAHEGEELDAHPVMF